MKRKDALFLSAKEVSTYMSISVPMAYKVIKTLNNELDSKGYLTLSGKINRRYFESKIFGGLPGGKKNASL